MRDKVNKFKVGDRVKRIVNEFPEILIGSEWVVREVLEGSNAIAVEGLSDYWTSDNFKLVLENGQDVKTYDHLKTKKFKVGDEVEIVSLMETIERFGGEDFILPIGSISVVNDVYEDDNELTLEDDFSYDPDDLKLIKRVDEIDIQQNESIKKTLYSPLNTQQAGDHYKKRGIQPIEYGLANNLSFPQVNVVKYITRHEDKNGLDDLAKSIHYHFFEALRVYGEEGTNELRNKVLSLLGIEQGAFK